MRTRSTTNPALAQVWAVWSKQPETSSCRILWGFPQRMADLFVTTGKPWMSSFRFL